MCGIAGFVSDHCTQGDLLRMGDALAHRGPDDTGCFFLGNTGLVSKRLSIIDLRYGKQPAYSEDEKVVVAFNGEIFNYATLREELRAKGHRISNNSDTAVLPHMYEEYGTAMFERLSGQFAIAVCDIGSGSLILARDRMGILPLNYYYKNNEFFFGSEIKAILASGRVTAKLCCEALLDVFTYWSPQYDRTVFSDVHSLLPGEFLVFKDRLITREKYFILKFGKNNGRSDFVTAAQDIETILCEAVKKRLAADVKVSAYLSGGLDSSLITAITAQKFDSSVEAYSIAFEDARLDESRYQKLVCDFLGIRHYCIKFSYSEIPALIRKIIRHAEVPLLRAGPVPLFRLSELARRNNTKVVLSGEGADELFGGYDIFREQKIRDYLKRYPDSRFRQKLFRKINTFSDSRFQTAPAGGLNYFYMHGGTDAAMISHYTRWRQFGFFRRFFSGNIETEIRKIKHPDFNRSFDPVCLKEFDSWTGLQICQYIEISSFLSRYLLSSQGDRMAMANSVEVRYPFLDDGLAEYCMSLDDRFKIMALNEKYILKKIARKYLPPELVNRRKFPYRSALDAGKIITDPYLAYILSKEAISRFGVFDPLKVCGFINTIAEKDILSERESMLFMGILTTQILCELFGLEP